jgi:hypothetical protein
MDIPFDTINPNLRNEVTRVAREITKARVAQLKLGDPHKEPPQTPPLNPNPRKHDVVAWRHDGARLDTTRHDTKEGAQEYGRALCWAIYYKYAILCGRDIIERHSIAIPDGMALNDSGMPVKI